MMNPMEDKKLEELLETARTQANEGKVFGILGSCNELKKYLGNVPSDRQQAIKAEMQQLEVTAYKNAITRYLSNARKLAEEKQPVFMEAYLNDVERFAEYIQLDVKEDVAKIRESLKR